MKKLGTAVSAFAIYWAWVNWNQTLLILILASVIGASAILALFGAWLGDRVPTVAAFLVKLWDLAVLASLGIVVAMLALWAASLALGEPSKATASEKAYFALGAALFAAIGESVLKVFEKISSAAVAKRYICPRYQALFPSQPSGPPKAVTAYRTVRDACSEPTVGFGDLKDMLSAVKDAR